MKIILFTVSALLFAVNARAVDVRSQMSLEAGGAIGSLFMYGTLLQPIGGSPLLFTYAGYDFTRGDTNVKLLGGTYHASASSTAVTASVWWLQRGFIAKEMNLFAEADMYIPTRAHDELQLFAVTRVTRTLGADASAGAAAEYFGTTHAAFKAAVGPVITVNHLRVFVAYDFATNGVLLRVYILM